MNICCEYGCKMPEYTVHPRDMLIKIFPVDDTVNDTVTLTDDEKLILDLLTKDCKSSYDVLITKTKFSRSKVYRLIKGLKEKQIVEYVGSDKTGFWKVVKV